MRVIDIWRWHRLLGTAILSSSGCANLNHANHDLTATPITLAAEGPHRKLGLWEQRLTFVGANYSVPASRMCIYAATEPRRSLIGAQMDRNRCETYRIKRTDSSTLEFPSDCALDQSRHITSSATIVDDLDSAYHAKAYGVVSERSDDPAAKNLELDLDAKWVGSCPDGMRGRDVTSNGETSDVFDR